MAENQCRLPGRRIYAPGIGKRHRSQSQPDLAAVLGGLRSPDEQDRVKALHAVCPCAAAALGPVAARLELVGGTAA
jgi:hypothetical protein